MAKKTLTKNQIFDILMFNTVNGVIETGYRYWLTQHLSTPPNQNAETMKLVRMLAENTEDIGWPMEDTRQGLIKRLQEMAEKMSNNPMNIQKEQYKYPVVDFGDLKIGDEYIYRGDTEAKLRCEILREKERYTHLCGVPTPYKEVVFGVFEKGTRVREVELAFILMPGGYIKFGLEKITQ